jgi:hypothetical protein
MSSTRRGQSTEFITQGLMTLRRTHKVGVGTVCPRAVLEGSWGQSWGTLGGAHKEVVVPTHSSVFITSVKSLVC